MGERQGTTARLLEATRELWDAYNQHPFVLGIQDGTLPREKFRHYILQDYLYLQEYAKVYAIGIAKARSAATTALFSNYVNILTGTEMDIHRGYMGRFAVTQEEIDSTPRSLTNLAYTSYMLRVAYEEGEAEILAAVLSCGTSYEVVAKKLAAANPAAADHPFYGDWVRGYISEAYAGANREMEQMLDDLTRDYTEAQLQHIEEIFTACSRFEKGFWDMAWEMSF